MFEPLNMVGEYYIYAALLFCFLAGKDVTGTEDLNLSKITFLGGKKLTY